MSAIITHSSPSLFAVLRWEWFQQRGRIGLLGLLFGALLALEFYFRRLFDSTMTGDFPAFFVFLGTLAFASQLFSEYKNPKQQILAMMLPVPRWQQMLVKSCLCLAPMAIAVATLIALNWLQPALAEGLPDPEKEFYASKLFWLKWTSALFYIQFYTFGGLIFSNMSAVKTTVSLCVLLLTMLLLQVAFLGDFLKYILETDFTVPGQAFVQQVEVFLDSYIAWISLVTLSLTVSVWLRFRAEEIAK